MGSLREVATGTTILLEPEHVIGRGLACALRLGQPYVSAVHALLRWTGRRWELKDLGSRNGTFVNGSLIEAGEGVTAAEGSRIAFGKIEEEWALVDAGPPREMAVPLDGGEPVLIDRDLLALPSPQDPRVTIYRGPGGWLLEQIGETVGPVTNRQIIECDGRAWRFCCSEEVPPTTRFVLSSDEVSVGDLELSFAVSRDEEHVQLSIGWARRTIDLGARAHHYLLLTLARRRLADARAGLPETACGWVDHADFAHDPRLGSPQLNIDVFRIRQQFSAQGIVDAANIIERRSLARQLRIGTGRIAIAVL